MDSNKKIVIRCRGVILHDGKLLLVRHAPNGKFFALPGGHLEWGEDVKECLSRELVEELRIKPEIGRLLYVNSLIKEKYQYIEFFFEILNGKEYKKSKSLSGTHSHEIAEIIWAGPKDGVCILPKQIAEDFKTGRLISKEVRYIKN